MFGTGSCAPFRGSFFRSPWGCSVSSNQPQTTQTVYRIINFQDLRSSTGNDCRSPECRRDRPQGLTPCKGGLSGCGIGRSFLPCNAAQRLRFWDFESSQEAFFGRTAHFHTHTHCPPHAGSNCVYWGRGLNLINCISTPGPPPI